MDNPCPINNLERILLATDGSEYSAGAEREAINLASHCKSKLVAIQVIVANQEFIAYAPDLLEKQETEASAHLETVKAQAEKAGVECETATHIGDAAYEVIVDEVQKSQSEIIVMGRRGLSGIAKVAMGSVTERVIGHSPVNVLVVPRKANLKCKAILAATDGSEFGDVAVQEGIKISKRCGSPLLVLSVASSESVESEKQAQQALEKAKSIAAEESFEIQTLLAYGKTSTTIVETAKARNIDLIVVSSHGHSGLERLLMGSVTQRVVGHAESAILVARAF